MAIFTDELKYECVVNLRVAESSVFWSMTQTYLLAETLLAAFLLQAPDKSSLLLRELAAILGVGIGILWAATTQRVGDYHTLRVRQGKALENGDAGGLFRQDSEIRSGFSAKSGAVLLAIAFVLFFVAALLESAIRG